MRLIQRHAAGAPETKGLYIYLAYQNVHEACGTHVNGDPAAKGQGLHAPCKLVDTFYARTPVDTYKVMGGMISTLDNGVGALTAERVQYGSVRV